MFQDSFRFTILPEKNVIAVKLSLITNVKGLSSTNFWGLGGKDLHCTVAHVAAAASTFFTYLNKTF